MKRDKIIELMKSKNIKHIALIENETDQLGKLANLSPSNKLSWYDGGVVRLTQDIWGYIEYTNGKPTRKAFN